MCGPRKSSSPCLDQLASGLGAVAQWLAYARNQVKVAIILWVELQVKALCVSTLVDPTVFIMPLCVQHVQRLLHTLKVPFSPFDKARHYW